MKVAICFWGLARSLKYTHDSIVKYIFNPLSEAGISYDTYFHTYHIDGVYNNPRAGEKDLHLDNEEYKILKADYVKVDNQNDTLKEICPEKYRTHPDPWATGYKCVDFFLLSMYSRKQVYNLTQETGIKYDIYMYVRPDVKYYLKLNPKIFEFINSKMIIVPKFQHIYPGGPFNDRFAIMRYEIFKTYSNIFDDMLSISKRRSLHSESMIREYLITHIKDIQIRFIPFYFNRVRANGYERPDCNKEIRLLRLEQTNKNV